MTLEKKEQLHNYVSNLYNAAQTIENILQTKQGESQDWEKLQKIKSSIAALDIDPQAKLQEFDERIFRNPRQRKWEDVSNWMKNERTFLVQEMKTILSKYF
jgi:DNA-binding SARP family transcriptional activator